ncbi:hypothetical protein CO674_26880 [Rhizobium hidalgonense]|uniref:GAD-related domain-containing protein n=1 Tax=Rhizobium hidalgonense TaxID=1538159 RepID=A0ABX4JKR3_9HYPH|nr:hypothetical protein CO674_26880 [Rhizobium hidalgonense]
MPPLQEILDEFGLKDGIAASASQAAGYRGKLPDAMVDFWVEHGRGHRPVNLCRGSAEAR